MGESLHHISVGDISKPEHNKVAIGKSLHRPNKEYTLHDVFMLSCCCQWHEVVSGSFSSRLAVWVIGDSSTRDCAINLSVRAEYSRQAEVGKGLAPPPRTHLNVAVFFYSSTQVIWNFQDPFNLQGCWKKLSFEVRQTLSISSAFTPPLPRANR